MAVANNLVVISLLIGCGLALSEITWKIVEPYSGVGPLSGALQADVSTTLQQAGGPIADLTPIRALHFFGRYIAPTAVTAPPPVAVIEEVEVETSLNLTLKGIFFTEDTGAGRALIAEGRGLEAIYKVGDAVTPQATVYAIEADHVILERGGQLERLGLPKLDKSTNSRESKRLSSRKSTSRSRSNKKSDNRRKRGRASPATATSASTTRMGDMREKMLKDPAAAMKLAKIRPVMKSGKMQGYSINPGSDPQLFAEVGLKPGDLVTEVNGIRVTDPSKMGDVLNQLTTASALTVTVERNGQLKTLSINF